MTITQDRDDAWFEPKRFGIGAGLPIAWQGWALTAGFVAATAGLAAVLLPRHRVPFTTTTAVLMLAFLVTAARHTRGGWRWRWGESD